MNTFEKRDNYGEEAVQYFNKKLDKENILYKRIKELQDWNSNLDLINGDIIIKEKIRIDIKRNSISEKSLNNFQGEFFAICHHYLKEIYFFKSEDIKNNARELGGWETLSSGDRGIKLKVLKREIPYLIWDEF